MGLPEAGWDTVPKPTQKFMDIAESVEAETLQQPKKKDRVGKKKAAVVVVECEVDEGVESDNDSLDISEQSPARSQTRRGRGIQRLAKYDISISKSFIYTENSTENKGLIDLCYREVTDFVRRKRAKGRVRKG